MKQHIRLAVRNGWQCRVWTNSLGHEIILNRIAPVGHCIRP
jgi:hypothetical protein